MFEHSCKDYHSMHAERIKLRLERICQVKLPSSFEDDLSIKPKKFPSKEYDQLLYSEARSLMMNDKHSFPCQDTIECVLQFRTYEDVICTDLLEEDELMELKTILDRDTPQISNNERYNDYLDYYDLSESKDESIDCQLVSEEIYQSFYNPSIIFSTLLEKAKFNRNPERKTVSSLVSDELLSKWTSMNSLPIQYTDRLQMDSWKNLEEMAFGKEDFFENVKEISYEEIETIHDSKSIELRVELVEQSNCSTRYNIDSSMKFLKISQEILISYFFSEMTQHGKVPKSDMVDIFELDTPEDTKMKLLEIESRCTLNMLEEFTIYFQDSFKSTISDIVCHPKTVKTYWCLEHLEKEIEEERKSIFSSDSIINSDDVKTIPCPLLDAKPGTVRIIPIEDIINKPKSTSNIEITLQNLWLSDSIYRSRKEAEWSDGKNLTLSWAPTKTETGPTERFNREIFEDFNDPEIMLKISNSMAPDSKGRIFAERIHTKISEIEELEREFQIEDMAFIGDLFQQTSIYSETASYYMDDGKGAIYKYESLLETLTDMDNFENYNSISSEMEDEQEYRIIVQDSSPHLSPIKGKEETVFNEILEDNLDTFLTFKKPSLTPCVAHKEKEITNEEEKLFLPEDIKISSKHSQMVKSILTQNSIVVLQADELRIVEGILILQKLKNCSSDSMFVHIDSDETRLEQDFRFIRSFLCNHTKSISIVIKDNFTTKISNITQDCKILFISRCIAENFIQRMERVLSKCCLIIYKELVLIEQDQFIPILKFVESMYSISKKNIQTVVMSSIPARDVSQLAHLLDTTMSKQLLLDSSQTFIQKISVPVSGGISKFLDNVIKVGEFTLSSISGVKGYNFESMKFLNLQSEFLKRIVEEFGTNLKVVLSSNDSKRIIETRATFKRLVCLHTLKYLFEATLDGGLSVGRAYLEKIKETDTYRTLLDGAISEISFQMVKLANETEDYSKAQTVAQTAKEQYRVKSKILILSKHNKVLLNIANKFEEGMNIFTLYNVENKLYLKSLHQGAEILFSEGLINADPHIYLTTFSNIANIVGSTTFNGINLLIQVEPGEFNDILYSMVCRNVIEYVSISSKLVREDAHLSLDNLSHNWVKSLRRLLKKEKDLVVHSKLVDQLFQKRKNIDILQEEDAGHLERNSGFKLKPDKATIRIIITDKCIQNNDLISELESRFAINVVERSSTLFSPADIIVNERHCIIVYRFHHIDSYREEVADIFNRILSLSLQFSYCWIVIENYSGGLASIDSLSFVSSSLLCFTKSLQIEVNLRYSYNMDQSAEIINSICLEVMAQSKSLNHEIIWIREKENPQEAFLSKFPSVNFYSAQAIVENYSIKDICRMKSIEEFSQHLGRYFTETGLKLLYNVLFEIFDGFEENNVITTEEVEDEQYRSDNVMEISQDNPSHSNSFVTQPDLSHSYINPEPNTLTVERPVFVDNSNGQKRLFSTTQHEPFSYQHEPIFQPFKKTKIVEITNTERIPPPSPLFQKHEPVQEIPRERAFSPFNPMFTMEPMHTSNFQSIPNASKTFVRPSVSPSSYRQYQEQYDPFAIPSYFPIHYQEQQPHYRQQKGIPVGHANSWNNNSLRSNTTDFNPSNMKQTNTTILPSKNVPNTIKNIVKLQVPPSDNTPRTKIDFNSFKYKPGSTPRNGKSKKW